MGQRESSLGSTPQKQELSSSLQLVLIDETTAKIMKTLQGATCKLEGTNKDGDTAYHLILRNARLTEEDIIAISKIFRERGVNPNTKNERGDEVVHCAIENRMRNVTDFFMQCRRSSSIPNDTLTKYFVERENAKFWSEARSNHDEMRFWDIEETENESASFLEWLISRESDFDRRNNEGIGSLEVALECNLQHLLPVLLNRLADSSCAQLLERFLTRNSNESESHRISKLWHFCYKSRCAAKIARVLLNKGAAAEGLWTRYVRLVIEGKEDVHIVKMLVDRFPADCDEAKIATALFHLLIEYPAGDLVCSEIDCYRQILGDLIARGVAVDERMILAAINEENMHAAVLLNEFGANFAALTGNSESLLHLLVGEPWMCVPVRMRRENAREAIFDFLVGKGCDVNARDSRGATPLHLAAECHNKAMAKMLIERGADVNCRDEDSRTPLHYAGVGATGIEMIELLLENGAKVNAKDGKGESFFFQSVAGVEYLDDLKVLKLLVKWGAPVNALHGYDDRALVVLVRRIDEDTFQEFLEYGLDVNNSSFCNSLYEHYDIERLMRQHCIKLKAAELRCSEDYSSRSGDKQKCQDYYEECLKEVETLKVTFINSRTSLCDFLRMNLSCRCAYINNEKLKSLVDSPNLETQFPLYSTIILASYREAVTRKCLLEPAKTAWLELTEIDLPDICIERVLSYLSNVDLVNVIEP